jgi:hypothetical protein
MTATNKIVGATLLVAAMMLNIASVEAKDRSTKTPEQECQAQSLASIAREWQNVTKGQFEIILKGRRCLVFLQADSKMYEGKRTSWLIEGATGELLAEWYGPRGSNTGMCSYRAGKFKTGECTVEDYMDKADQM